jgi:diguanylate cyclase (GGDEF)-like protein/PAS domain S-box-containing protein
MPEEMGKARFSLADRVALLALGGVAASGLMWALFAWVDSLISGRTFAASLLSPAPSEQVFRLSTMVVILLATLMVEALYARRKRAEQLLKNERVRVQQIYDYSPEAIMSIGPDHRVQYANGGAATLFGRAAYQFLGATCHESAYGCDVPCEGCPLASVFESGEVCRRTVETTNDGQRRFLEQVFYAVRDAEDNVVSVVESTRDTTTIRMAQEALRRTNDELEALVAERTVNLRGVNDALEAEIAEHRRTEMALTESEARYRQLVESSPDMVLVHRHGRITFLNSQGARLLGFSTAAEALGLPVAILIEPNGSGHTTEELITAVQSGALDKPTHVKLRRSTGELIDVELSVGQFTYEGEDAVQCIMRDISERVRAQETIQRMAYYDPLTDLPNRALFRDRLGSALAQARRRNEIVAVVFIDLDDFKAINDTLGHGVGDGVLVAVSKKIRGVLREEDTVSRQGGDEFTIIARVQDREAAGTLAERLLDAISASFDVEGHQLRVSASIGVATYPNDGERDADLIRNADAAMYRAKEWGHNVYRLYSPDMSESAAGRLELEAAMRRALERDEFELYFQPQVDIRDGRFVGVEALLRWNHPERGLLSPGDFIELAEQAGFIGAIGHWVLNTACEQARLWRAEGLKFGRIAVNLSAREFVQRNIVENVAYALDTSGLDPSMLELEITETVAMYNVEQILAILQVLRDMGVRVAIDDFGTGYSSMSYLKRFPIQTLKIAQDFMRDVDVDLQSQAIASMLIELCHELKLDIVAEGVENETQLSFLRDRGCYVIQGYLISRPVSSGEIGDILRHGLSPATSQMTLPAGGSQGS